MWRAHLIFWLGVLLAAVAGYCLGGPGKAIQASMGIYMALACLVLLHNMTKGDC